jgi:hypothetical protein
MDTKTVPDWNEWDFFRLGAIAAALTIQTIFISSLSSTLCVFPLVSDPVSVNSLLPLALIISALLAFTIFLSIIVLLFSLSRHFHYQVVRYKGTAVLFGGTGVPHGM